MSAFPDDARKGAPFGGDGRNARKYAGGARPLTRLGPNANDPTEVACLTSVLTPTLTPAQIARLYRDAMRDKGYQQYPLGQHVADYLRLKRKRLTDTSYRDYEGSLDKFVRFFCDLDLPDFEPPVGTTRAEDFLDHQYGGGAPRTYNKNLSILRDFFKWAQLRALVRGDPTLAIERARKRDVHREIFREADVRRILAANQDLRDRVALRLLLHYGIRKGALQSIQVKHFDHVRKRLTIFTKGRKIRDLPLPDPALWHDLERLILERELAPQHHLMWRYKTVPCGPTDADGKRHETKVVLILDKHLTDHGMHKWWYRRLAHAGIVTEGTTSGEKMHKARHTAGQRVLDRTGNLKAVQRLLGHASIQTTGDTYVDHDIDQLAQTLADVLNFDHRASA